MSTRSLQNVQSPLIHLRSFYTKCLTTLEESWNTLSLPLSDVGRQELDLISKPEPHLLIGQKNAINLSVFQILQDEMKQVFEKTSLEFADEQEVYLNERDEEEEEDLSSDEDQLFHRRLTKESILASRNSFSEESAFEQEKRDLVSQLEGCTWMTARHYQEVNRSRPKVPINFLGLSSFGLMNEDLDSTRVPVRPDPDILLTIQFQQPHHMTKRAVEYLVLGHQHLTALKDVIECRWDHLIERPKLQNSFLFIENTFYNDMRHPFAIDLSQGIREWTEEKQRHDSSSLFPDYQAYTMEDVTFMDLSIRLNVPYIYVHQGDCEHIFMISDIRLIHANDSHDLRKYPKKIFRGKMSRRTCMMCRLYPAKHLTIGDKLTHDYVCYFCDTCYDLLHYDEEGTLIYEDFHVYPYYGDS